MRTRRLLCGVGVVVALGLGAGCAHDGAHSARGPEEKLQRVFASKVQLVDQLALFDQEQIALGQMALERSSNDTVRAFAEMLVRYHSAHLEDLHALARAQSFSLTQVDLASQDSATGGSGLEDTAPGENTRFEKEGSRFIQRRDELAGRDGADFDRRFLHWVHKTQHQGKRLAQEGLEHFRADTSLALMLHQTVSTMQREHRHLDTVRRFIGD